MNLSSPSAVCCPTEAARRHHDAIVAFAAGTPCDAPARALSDAMQRAVDALEPHGSAEPWFVVYNRRLSGARAFLAGIGMTPERNDARAMVPEWRVCGWRGLFSNEDLVALAVSRGFEG